MDITMHLFTCVRCGGIMSGPNRWGNFLCLFCEPRAQTLRAGEEK